jgi:hypothetical protein
MSIILLRGWMNGGASHVLDGFVLLPLLHILVEERAGERRSVH